MPKKVKVKKVRARRGALTVDVYSISGRKVGTTALPKEIFAATVNPPLMAQAVHVHLANKRKGTASTKTRGEVSGSTRKIYRQKGTGRARHGSIRAPIFVHGGVAFGPKPKHFSFSLPRQMRQKALFSSLASKLRNKEIKVVAKLATISPKTKEMASLMRKLSIDGKVLIIMPEPTEQVKRVARNIEGVSLASASNLSTYDILSAETLLFMEEAIPVIKRLWTRTTSS